MSQLPNGDGSHMPSSKPEIHDDFDFDNEDLPTGMRRLVEATPPAIQPFAEMAAKEHRGMLRMFRELNVTMRAIKLIGALVAFAIFVSPAIYWMISHIKVTP